MESKRKEAFILNLNKKALELHTNDNFIDCLLLFQRAEIILKDYQSVKLKLLTYNNMASYYLRQNNYDLSMDYLSYCTKLQPVDLSSYIFQIGAYLNLSSLKSKLNKHKDSLTCAFKALHLLDDYPNECLSILCHYSICLEYLSLNQLRSSEEFFEIGYKASIKYFGSEHWISLSFLDMKKALTGLGNSYNEICILGDNLPNVKKKSLGQASRRKVSLDVRNDDGIKINTTPWLEQDNWKVSYVDDLGFFKIRKKRELNELSKSVAMNNDDLLEKIDKIISKSKKVIDRRKDGLEWRERHHHKAAVKIQRAFRKYLGWKKGRKFSKILISPIRKEQLDKIEGNKYRTKSELKGKNLKAKYRELFDGRVKVFRKSDLNLF